MIFIFRRLIVLIFKVILKGLLWDLIFLVFEIILLGIIIVVD